MIVVDVNIILYFLVAGQRTPAARAIFEYDSEWLLPTLLPHEFLNVLVIWYKQGYLSEHQCLNAWRRGLMMFEGRLIQPDMEAALKLALRHQITAYDAQYVELARSRKLSLVTEDGEILRKFPAIARTMTAFLKEKN